MKVSNIKIANTKPSGNSGGGNNSETNKLAKDQQDQMELRERVLHNKLKPQYEETSGLKKQIKDMLDEASSANVETNEAPVESVSQPKASDGYLKEFDEICFHDESDGFWGGETIVKTINAEHLGDVQGKLLPKLRNLFVSSIESARRDGEYDGQKRGYQMGLQDERQRVVEMIQIAKKKHSMECDFPSNPVCTCRSGSYNQALVDLQSKLGENHAK